MRCRIQDPHQTRDMDKQHKAALFKLVGEGLEFDCPMASYTTLRVGGQAEILYKATDLEGLRRLIPYLSAEGIPYLVVGGGSNLLVMDSGVEGVVILLRGSLAAIERPGRKEGTILAGAGATTVDLLNTCRREGLGGLEFLAWIPATVGGAVFMNAGAFGKEMGDRVREVHMVTPEGDVIRKERSQLRFSYRSMDLEKGSIIFRVGLGLDPVPRTVLKERMKYYQDRRKALQPLEFPSAGSVFKNPPGHHAGRLIEAAGLKGKRIGGAMISEKHANFIVNTGGATAKDVLALLHMTQETIQKETGIELEPEIQVVGR